MLRDLLSSRLIQAGMVFFVLIVGGSLLYSWHVRRSTDRYLAPHAGFLEHLIRIESAMGPVTGVSAPIKIETPGEPQKPLAPVSSLSSGAGAANRQKTFSQLLATMDEMVPEDYIPRFKAITENEFYALSVEEQERMKEVVREALRQEQADYYAEQSLEPPPPGYSYGWFNGGPARLFKKNEPYVHIIEDGSEGYGADWQLSDTEWERYIALGAIKNKHTAKSLQLSREVVELAAVWYQELHEKTWGKQPSVAVHVTYNRPITGEDKKRERELALAKLASIRPPDRSRRVNYDIVYQLITEIEAEINR